MKYYFYSYCVNHGSRISIESECHESDGIDNHPLIVNERMNNFKKHNNKIIVISWKEITKELYDEWEESII